MTKILLRMSCMDALPGYSKWKDVRSTTKTRGKTHEEDRDFDIISLRITLDFWRIRGQVSRQK
jgi:hypothetical protein